MSKSQQKFNTLTALPSNHSVQVSMKEVSKCRHSITIYVRALTFVYPENNITYWVQMYHICPKQFSLQ
jgi:hypothetical protein